jgi:phosphonate transport system permease protein
MSAVKAPSSSNKPARPPAILSLSSVIVPGLGQALYGEYRRAGIIFLIFITSLVTTLWYAVPVWYILPAAIWAWNIWDAYNMPKGAPLWIVAILWLAMAYGIGWQVTGIDILSLIKNRERAASVIRPMLKPDFIAKREISYEYFVPLQVPCSLQPPRAESTSNGVHLRLSPDCAAVGENIILTGEGLRPNMPTEVSFIEPSGMMDLLGENNSKMLVTNTDTAGKISLMFPVPTGINVNPEAQTYRISIVQRKILPGYEISQNGKYILQGIYETLALALLATTLGAMLALPISFLAARNLMSANPLTYSIYVTVRTLLNIFRSIEALIIAIVFVVIVGLGPFPGMLALTMHTTAALGKLYSEVIEGIDPGPIEAIRATGANWSQIVFYAVVPQIVPSFTALTIYRWDINVRSSTIIGFVGGGGIGFFLWQWIILGDYRAVSAAFISIAIVVMIMDFFSAKLRERLD